MAAESNNPYDGPCVKVPDEVWSQLFALRGKGGCIFWASIRLLSGAVIDDLIITNRGYILGREAAGLAGAHGAFDNSVLTFKTEDIEGLLLRTRWLFFYRSRWLCLNPRHPARREYEKLHGKV